LKGYPAKQTVAGLELIQKIEIGKPFFVTFRYNYVSTKSEQQGLICLREWRFRARGLSAGRGQAGRAQVENVQIEQAQVEKETQARSARAMDRATVSLVR
jgi:hypothetical protein